MCEIDGNTLMHNNDLGGIISNYDIKDNKNGQSNF